MISVLMQLEAGNRLRDTFTKRHYKKTGHGSADLVAGLCAAGNRLTAIGLQCEGILPKHSNARVYYKFFFCHRASKEHPRGGDQRDKSQHETNEEPDMVTCLTQTTFTVNYRLRIVHLLLH